jgi:hypothetical protein
VYSYFGNGIITVDEHAAGTFFTSFNLNTSQLLRIDVTSLVQNAINANQQYVGFRLSTPGGPDRYATGPASGLPYPLLNVVPEPSSIALLLTGVTALFGRRRMRMHPLL